MPYKDPNDRRLSQADYYRRVIAPNRQRGRPRGKSAVALLKEEKKLIVSTRLPASLVGRLHRIVNEANATGAFPWKTTAAAIAALLVRGMETMRNDPFIAEQLEYLHALENIRAIQDHRVEAQNAMGRIRVELNELLAIKATEDAARVYAEAMDEFQAMSPNVWRTWLVQSMEKAFPRLAIEAKNVRRDISFKARKGTSKSKSNGKGEGDA